MARIIATSHTWTAKGPMTNEDWALVIRVALALQKTDPEDVERALIVYMILDR